MQFRLLAVAAVGASLSGCVVDSIEIGDRCSGGLGRMCRTDQVSFYCAGEPGSYHWAETDCWSTCLSLGYEAGACEQHSRYGDGTCMCTPPAGLTLGDTCSHEGDQICLMGADGHPTLTLDVCLDGTVREVDCTAACAGRTAACGYDPIRGDDSCLCTD
jgi:hypothetical protein